MSTENDIEYYEECVHIHVYETFQRQWLLFNVQFSLADNSENGSYESDEFGDDVMLDANSYVAIMDYTKQAQDELSVSKGQVVNVVDDSDTSE